MKSNGDGRREWGILARKQCGMLQKRGLDPSFGVVQGAESDVSRVRTPANLPMFVFGLREKTRLYRVGWFQQSISMVRTYAEGLRVSIDVLCFSKADLQA